MSEPGMIAGLPEAQQLYLRGVFERAEARFSAVLQGQEPDLAHVLARAVVQSLESELAPLFPAMADAGTPVACGKGCVWCCTLTVEVSPDEVFAILTELRRTLSPDAFTDFARRLRLADARGHGLPALERHRLRQFCPVLDPASGSCLAYAVRPSGCQVYVSLDLAACRENYQHSTGTIPQPVIANLLRDIIADTRKHMLGLQGIPSPKLELTAALAAALDSAESETRWRQGETVLTTALFPADS